MLFLILLNDLSQHLGDLHNSVNWCFSDDQCMMLQSHAFVKDPSKAEEEAMHLNETEYKFLDTVSYSTV